ncbi:MAG: hypothetical protein HZA09_06835 [Nitrospirae bacterium]|nr:hypothetical protein [Nitrospirota bacterium]
MGEAYPFQPLTKKDKVTVVLYRIGIALSSVIIAILAYVLSSPSYYQNDITISMKFDILLIFLYMSVGLSVFTIHLYVSKFKRFLKKLYYLSAVSLIILFVIGKGDVLGVLIDKPFGSILLIPLSGCIGFITAKEAFCFKLFEGYLLTLIMPLYLLLLSMGSLTMQGVSLGIIIIALMLILFTFRKVFMPLHYDIGDKSAYT